MTPYVESGRSAQRRLHPVAADARESRLLASLRGFKQVINLLGVTGIVLIPLVGVWMHSSLASAVVSLHFLVVIVLLELMERRVKHELETVRTSQQPFLRSRNATAADACSPENGPLDRR